MGLAYYVTFYGRVAPRAKTKSSSASNSTVTDNGAKKSTTGDKKPSGSDKKTTNSDKTSTKSEKAKKSGKKDAGKKKKEEQEKDRIYRRKTPYIDIDNVDLTNIPALQWPIPPADADRPFIIEILTGEKAIRRKKYKQALQEFETILSRFPQSPRGMFGKAETMCAFAEYKRSNKYLDLCIDAYWNVGVENILASSDLRREALLRLADRATFRGKMQTSLRAWEELSRHFPEERYYAKQVAMSYLTANKNDKALEHFKIVVNKWPDDTFSKAHMGLILKLNNRLEEALPLLLDGLRNDDHIQKLAKFYHHCGECLTQLARHEEVILFVYG